MGIARSSRVAALLLSGSLTVIPFAVSDQAVQSQSSKQQSEQTYAQVVRLSYVQGDVRIARGKASKEASGSDWESAVTGLPIETGFNLVTGQGRAEIEFEDASTVYLADNSVLSFNDLHTTDGVPYTNIALLTGTATLHVQHSPDTFVLLTPTARVTPSRVHNSYFRITSYADGNAIAARANMAISLPDTAGPTMDKAGSGTLYYRGDTRVAAPDGSDAIALAAWDQWVDQRVAARTAATHAVMVQAGLTTPIPGLADLNDKGTFFSCEPYGTCWEPKDSAEPAAAGTGKGPEQELSQESAQESTKPEAQAAGEMLQNPDPVKGASRSARRAAAGSASPVSPQLDPYEYFPCMPDRIALMLASTSSAGAIRRMAANPLLYDHSWDWARCHAGYWIHYRNRRRYTWVVGRRIHHRIPVHWMKYDGKTAFVPRNPKDEPGKPPLNREQGVFVVKGKGDEPVRFAEYDPKAEVKLLNAAPKEFLKPVYAPLQRADEPHPEVRTLEAHSSLPAGQHPEEMRATLAFDHKSQSFLLAHQVTTGGKTTTVLQPFAGRSGALQAHVGGMDAHGSYSMHASSGGGVGHVGGSAGGSAGFSGGGHFSGGGVSASSSVSSASSGASSAGAHK
jgi:uncharacterized membrane protein YgcG